MDRPAALCTAAHRPDNPRRECRRRHLAPLSLFLIANLVYFFHPPLTDLNMSLAEQIELQPWGPVAERMLEARLEARGIEMAEYAAE